MIKKIEIEKLVKITCGKLLGVIPVPHYEEIWSSDTLKLDVVDVKTRTLIKQIVIHGKSRSPFVVEIDVDCEVEVFDQSGKRYEVL